MDDLRRTNRREMQLDAISSLLIVAMGMVVALLLYVLFTGGLHLPPGVPLDSELTQILLSAFVLVVIAYLWDQRRRLREEVNRAVSSVEQARSELETSNAYLYFSHQAASRLGAQGIDDAMSGVLHDATELFRVDAAAMLGEDAEHVFIAEGVPESDARRALAHVAAVAAGKVCPFHVAPDVSGGGQAIAVPLRVKGELRYVLALWKRSEEFQQDQLDALGLMGRMVELAIEREESLGEANDQLEGTLRVLEYLVASKRPDYSRHSRQVADLAAGIGQKLGLSVHVRRELQLAGLVHDVGLMALAGSVSDAGSPLTAEEWLAVRQHATVGGEVARAANFGEMVQEAVAGHHERMDGSGYPLGLRGTRIPLGARIIAVCEVYDSMVHRTHQGAQRDPADAMAELTAGAGKLYDRKVVSALQEIVAESHPMEDVM